MAMTELDRFRAVWDLEAGHTIRLLEALPADKYDFRADPKGRSIGELAWHLSEIDGYISLGVTKQNVTFEEPPPNMQRPREVGLLAPGYRRVHEEAVARLAGLSNDDLDREVRIHRTAADHPRRPVGCDSAASGAPPRPAVADVPAGGRHAAGDLRAESGRDGSVPGGEAGCEGLGRAGAVTLNPRAPGPSTSSEWSDQPRSRTS